MPNASDFGFSTEGQRPVASAAPVEDWRAISNAVFASKEKRTKLPEVAISSDLVSMLATKLGVTQIDAAPLVEVVTHARTSTTSRVEHVKALRNWFDLPLVLATRILVEIERIEALIDKGKALREGRYWTISFALFTGKRAEILIENGDTKTFDGLDWQNEVTHRGAIMTGGRTFVGDRKDAIAMAATTLAVDHYEIEVAG